MFITRKEIWRAAAFVHRRIVRRAMQGYEKNGDTDQQRERHTNPAHQPRGPDAVQTDRETDPRAGVSQLLVAVDADEDSEEDAADFPEQSQELENATRPCARDDEVTLEKNSVVDVHDDNLLQVGHGQSQQKELKGLHSGELGPKDGEDEKYVTHNSYARNEDPQAEEVDRKSTHCYKMSLIAQKSHFCVVVTDVERVMICCITDQKPLLSRSERWKESRLMIGCAHYREKENKRMLETLKGGTH